MILIENCELFIEYKISNKNNKKYGIQEKFNEPETALDILAKLDDTMSNFIKDLKQKYPSDDRVKRLEKGFKRAQIEEAPDEENTTSYTVNKGDVMALCLRHKTDNRPFHDIGTLSFVIIHEMAHIASITEGHNDEFVTNFIFLLKEAANLGYYTPVNYKHNPITYCGLSVTNNPYY
jgi:hypothetical protein